MSREQLLQGSTVGILCQYFPPEEGAAPERMRFFNYWLKESGANVIVCTAMPNYPQGIIDREYRGKIYSKEITENTLVLRSWCYTSPNRSAKNRILNYFSFMVLSLRWIFYLKKCDVIIFSSGPMFAGFAAYASKLLFKNKIILDARDLWPDRIWESGAIKLPGFIVKLLSGYESFMYKNVVAVTCVTKGVCDAIEARLQKFVPTILVRNCDQEIGKPIRKDRDIKNIHSKVRIVEAGTIGWAQDPETLFKAFSLFEDDAAKNAVLSFAGAGPRAEKLEKEIENSDLNISYMGQLSKKSYWEFLFDADIGVITLQPASHNTMTVSRRVYDYARAGLAIVYCGSGEGADIVSSTGAGIVVEPGDRQALSNVLQTLTSEPDELKNWKEKSKNILAGEFSSEKVAENLINTVKDVVQLNKNNENVKK